MHSRFVFELHYTLIIRRKHVGKDLKIHAAQNREIRLSVSRTRAMRVKYKTRYELRRKIFDMISISSQFSVTFRYI